ncbi:hypothetical protein BT96DRAFT_971736, partial [Gymnopus androsaceus JB14]
MQKSTQSRNLSRTGVHSGFLPDYYVLLCARMLFGLHGPTICSWDYFRQIPYLTVDFDTGHYKKIHVLLFAYHPLMYFVCLDYILLYLYYPAQWVSNLVVEKKKSCSWQAIHL